MSPVIDLSSSQKTMISCDFDSEDNKLEAVFNLENFRQTYYENIEVKFYGSTEDASLENNPLPGSYTSEEKIVYVLSENDSEYPHLQSKAR